MTDLWDEYTKRLVSRHEPYRLSQFLAAANITVSMQGKLVHARERIFDESHYRQFVAARDAANEALRQKEGFYWDMHAGLVGKAYLEKWRAHTAYAVVLIPILAPMKLWPFVEPPNHVVELVCRVEIIPEHLSGPVGGLGLYPGGGSAYCNTLARAGIRSCGTHMPSRSGELPVMASEEWTTL